MTTTCHHCGKTFTRDADQIRRARFSFCSRICKSSDHDFNKYAGERNGDVQRYRKGNSRSYVKFNGCHLHRVVAEEKLGRPLIRGEVVHHLDGNKLNNSPENISVISQSEHIKIHRSQMHQAKIKKDGFVRGERSGMSKLKNESVLSIRTAIAAGAKTKEIAQQFKVSVSTIQRVINGRGWSHVK